MIDSNNLDATTTNHKNIKTFVDSGLLFLCNQLLHAFGWVLVAYSNDDSVYTKIEVRPSDYFGFRQTDVQKHIDKFKNLTNSD